MKYQVNGEADRCLASIINFSFPGIDSEVAVEALDGIIAISTGAACTTASQTCSHVLTAMGCDEQNLSSAMRFSWCHETPEVDWRKVVEILETC